MASNQHSDKKIVWVLGSGFSVPLGGPILNQLLSPEFQKIIPDIFPEDNFPLLCGTTYFNSTYQLYNKGLKKDINPFAMWSNVEEYLDNVDTAANNMNSPAAHKLKAVIAHGGVGRIEDFTQLAITTRRIIASECSVFLQSTSTDLEEWQPYKKWARNTSGADTIITFNYDLVLENLCKKIGVSNFNYDGFFGTSAYTSINHGATILKLHGSVNWKIGFNKAGYSDTSFIVIGNPLEALQCDPKYIFIATPGPTKHEMVSYWFAPLWEKADESLKTADAVVFMGYRFPPSDANARDKLLGALMQNDSEDLRIFTVLGPDDNPDNRRLEALLKYATSRKPNGKATVTRLPLWAQDFMSLYTPEMLFEGNNQQTPPPKTI